MDSEGLDYFLQRRDGDPFHTRGRLACKRGLAIPFLVEEPQGWLTQSDAGLDQSLITPIPESGEKYSLSDVFAPFRTVFEPFQIIFEPFLERREC